MEGRACANPSEPHSFLHQYGPTLMRGPGVGCLPLTEWSLPFPGVGEQVAHGDAKDKSAQDSLGLCHGLLMSPWKLITGVQKPFQSVQSPFLGGGPGANPGSGSWGQSGDRVKCEDLRQAGTLGAGVLYCLPVRCFLPTLRKETSAEETACQTRAAGPQKHHGLLLLDLLLDLS